MATDTANPFFLPICTLPEGRMEPILHGPIDGDDQQACQDDDEPSGRDVRELVDGSLEHEGEESEHRDHHTHQPVQADRGGEQLDSLNC